MPKNSLKKLATIADDFLAAAGFRGRESAFLQEVQESLRWNEKQEVEDSAMSLCSYPDDDRTRLRLGEIFATAAVRNGAAEQGAGYIPVANTDEATVKTLQDAGAKNLARLVEIARSRKNP